MNKIIDINYREAMKTVARSAISRTAKVARMIGMSKLTRTVSGVRIRLDLEQSIDAKLFLPDFLSGYEFFDEDGSRFEPKEAIENLTNFGTMNVVAKPA